MNSWFSRRYQDRGATTFFIACIVFFVGLFLAVTVQLVVLLGQRVQAQNAADAAALAGALGGRSAADEVTAANQAKMTEYRDRGTWVDVEVTVGRASARARATRHVTSPLHNALQGPRTPVRVGGSGWTSSE